MSTRSERARQRDRTLSWKYGLTQDQYEVLVKMQDNSCLMCGATSSLVVDHCHDKTHEVLARGLLCMRCNGEAGHAPTLPLGPRGVAYLESSGCHHDVKTISARADVAGSKRARRSRKPIRSKAINPQEDACQLPDETTVTPTSGGGTESASPTLTHAATSKEEPARSAAATAPSACGLSAPAGQPSPADGASPSPQRPGAPLPSTSQPRTRREFLEEAEAVYVRELTLEVAAALSEFRKLNAATAEAEEAARAARRAKREALKEARAMKAWREACYYLPVGVAIESATKEQFDEAFKKFSAQVAYRPLRRLNEATGEMSTIGAMTSSSAHHDLVERAAAAGQDVELRWLAEDALVARYLFRSDETVVWQTAMVELDALTDAQLETLVVLSRGPICWADLLTATCVLGPDGA